MRHTLTGVRTSPTLSHAALRPPFHITLLLWTENKNQLQWMLLSLLNSFVDAEKRFCPVRIPHTVDQKENGLVVCVFAVLVLRL